MKDLFIEKLISLNRNLTSIKKHTVANVIGLQRIRKKLAILIVQEFQQLNSEKYQDILSGLTQIESVLSKGIKFSLDFEVAKDLLKRTVEHTFIRYLEEKKLNQISFSVDVDHFLVGTS